MWFWIVLAVLAIIILIKNPEIITIPVTILTILGILSLFIILPCLFYFSIAFLVIVIPILAIPFLIIVGILKLLFKH
jgi:hypothetical protein